MRHKQISQLFFDIIKEETLLGTPDLYYTMHLDNFNSNKESLKGDNTNSIFLLIPPQPNVMPNFLDSKERIYKYQSFVLKNFGKGSDKLVTEQGNGTNEDIWDETEELGAQLLVHFNKNAFGQGMKLQNVNFVYGHQIINEMLWGTRFDFEIVSLKNCLTGLKLP